MKNWIGSFVKSCSIAEWAISSKRSIQTFPIIYTVKAGELIFTPLSIAFDNNYDINSSTITIIDADMMSHVVILSGSVKQLPNPNMETIIQSWIAKNPSMSNFLQTKNQYLASHFAETIFSFNPTKIEYIDLKSNEIGETEVLIP